MKYRWLDEVRIEDLPEEWQTVADMIGLEGTLKVMGHFEGLNIYFPLLPSKLKAPLKRYISKRYRKHNVKKLVEELGVSERHIRQVVHDHQDQLDLFPRKVE